MRTLVVVNNPKDWDFNIEGVEIVAAKSYIIDVKYADIRGARIFNLCRSYKYQATGYYVSLLAEARGHRVFPSVSTMQDFKSQTIIRAISDDLDDLIQRNFRKLKSDTFDLSIYFGQNTALQYDTLCRQLYNLFQAPLIRAHFVFNKRWILQNISPIPINEVPESHLTYVVKFAEIYFSKKRIHWAKKPMSMYDLAILVNPEEKEPPSDKKAIKNFIEAGEEIGISTEIITKDDYSRIPEFDALFIRATTSVNHFTYRFSRRAQTEGLVVIDDPWDILKCTNKVYLAEILSFAKIATPKTIIVHKENKNNLIGILGLPIVLKQPDSSFSQGVIKASDAEELRDGLEKLFETSDLIIAQEYTYSDFDWRIGVIDKTPIFACKYFMAKGHWQIYNWRGKGSSVWGNFDTVPIKAVPPKVLHTAVRATNLIGDGLYGVDLKQIGDKVFVVEINDNPSLESGVEDKIIKEKLYRIIMKSFKERIEKMRKMKDIEL